jgi:sterol O-acyltransferase
MIMKMHSYMTTNCNLQYVSMQSKALLSQLQLVTKAAGGWEQAIIDAKSHRAGSTENSTLEQTPSGTPDMIPDSKTSYVDADTASALRKRLNAVAISSTSAGSSTPLSNAQSKDYPVHGLRSHPLVDHPDEEISTLAKDYSDLQSELTSTGPNTIQWPENITLKNFAIYQLIPTLVYELEYPRTDR